MIGDERTGPATPRDKWIPWIFAAGFAVVILVNGIMIYFATSSFTGLQTEGHYQRGLDYNQVLAAEAEENRLGWTVAIDFAETGNGRARVSVAAADRDGNPVDGASVRARLVRPVQAGHDIDIELTPAGKGLYAAELQLPLQGQWDILAQITHPSGKYRAAKRIVAR